MTIENFKKHPDYEQGTRAVQVIIMCYERGITDPEIITDYILRAYDTVTKEFPGRKRLSPSRAKKSARRAFLILEKFKIKPI